MKTLLSLILLIVIGIPSFAQPSNNDCSNAILIDVGTPGNCGTQVVGTLVDATASGVGLGSCADANMEDVFYKFVASSENLSIDFQLMDENISFIVYKNDCSSLSEVGCFDYSTSNTSDRLVIGLTPGALHFIKIQKRTAGTQAGDFAFCLSSSELADNIDCQNAEQIVVGVGGCAEDTHLNFNNYSYSDQGDIECGSMRYQDAWYKFTGPTTGSLKINSKEDVTMIIEVFENNCGNLSSIKCFGLEEFESVAMSGFVSGSEYFLRLVSNYGLPFGFDYSFCLEREISAMPNDECLNAINLSVQNGDCTNMETVNFDLASASPENSSYNIVSDAWYTFTAPSTGTIYIEEFTEGFSSSIRYIIYSGNCGTLSEIESGSVSDEKVIPNLISGQLYYLRVFSTSSFPSAKIFCLREGPSMAANDECNGAILLTVSTTSNCSSLGVDYNFDQASFSGLSSICDDSQNPRDLWYSFITPASGAVEIDAQSQHEVTLYTGTCGALTEYICGNGIFTGLTPGTTYYFSVSKGSSGIEMSSVCIKESTVNPPINDICTKAITLMDGDIQIISIGDASIESGAPQDCAVNVKDLWYIFTGPISGNIKLKRTSGSTLSFSLYKGSCGSLVHVGCHDASSDIVIENIPSGQIHYLQAHNENKSTFSPPEYQFIVLEKGPSNVDCVNASSLSTTTTCNPVDEIILDFDLAGESGQSPTSCSFSTTYNDLWFQIMAPPSGKIRIDEIDGSLRNAAIYSGSCGTLTEIDCKSFIETYTFVNLTSGTNYYLRLQGHDSTTVCITDPPVPANDECSGAIMVTVGSGMCGSSIIADFEYASNNDLSLNCNFSSNRIDLWYSFTAPTSESVIFQQMSGSRANYSIYENTCGALNQLNCFDLNENEGHQIDNLSVGQNYLFRIDISTSSPPNYLIDFCLLGVPSPPPNSDCKNATLIVASPDNSCSIFTPGTTAGTPPSTGNFCFGSSQITSFFEFTPNNSGLYDFTLLNNSADHYIELFTDCTIQNSVGCGENNASLMLNAGNAYTIAVYAKTASSVSSFELCVYPNTAAGAGGENVGVGINNPLTKLQINGGIRPGYTEITIPGNIRYSNDLEAYQDGGWKSLTEWDHQATKDIEMNGRNISSLNDPLNNDDAATKRYVDTHNPEWTEIQNIPAGIADEIDDVDDADNNPTNEKINQFTRNGTNLTIQENGQDYTISLDTFTNVFVRESTLLRNAESTDDDFLIGATQLPTGGSTTENLFFFDESKGAFRAGRLSNSNKWDASNLGDFSFATGFNTMASGSQSVAMGSNSTASGLTSLTFGNNNTSSGSYSVSLGGTNTSSGANSSTLGSQNTATRTASTAIGILSNATGTYSTAIGRNANAEAQNSFAAGRFNVGGGDPTGWDGLDPLFEIGNGANAGSLNNAFTVLKNGKVGINTATPSSNFQIIANSTSTNGHIELTETSTNDGGRIIFNHSVEPTNRWTLYGRTSDTETLNVFNVFHNLGGNVLRVFSDKTVVVEDTLLVNTLSTGGHIINVGNGAHLTTGGTWTNASSRSLKENFSPVNSREILTKLASMQILAWNYKQSSEGTHIGPIAEDFYELFGLGSTDAAISTVDADGIALLAIQALYQENQELSTKVENLKKANEDLISMQSILMEAIEKRVEKLELNNK